MNSSNDFLDSMIRSHDNLKNFLCEKGIDINYYSVTLNDHKEHAKQSFASKEVAAEAEKLFTLHEKLVSLCETTQALSPNNTKMSRDPSISNHLGYHPETLKQYLDENPNISPAAKNYIEELIRACFQKAMSLEFLEEGDISQAIECWYDACLIPDHELFIFFQQVSPIMEACSRRENDYKALFILANLNMNNMEYAIQLLNKCILLNKNIFQFYLLRACLRMFGKEGETNPIRAIEDFTKAINLSPTTIEMYYLRAAVYKQMGRDKLALALADYIFFINNIHEVNRKIPEAYYSLAYISLALEPNSEKWRNYYRLAEEAVEKLPSFHKKEKSTTKQLIEMILPSHQKLLGNSNTTNKKENNEFMKISNSSDKKCSQCGLSLITVLSCSRCHSSYYCNRECQRAHWQKHKITCK